MPWEAHNTLGTRLGIGASSFSYVNGVHYQNVTSLEDYLARVAEGRPPVGRACVRSPGQKPALIDCLVGDVTGKDMSPFLETLATMTPPPPPL